MPDFLPYSRRQLGLVLPMIGSAVYTSLATLEIEAWRTVEPVPYAARQSGEYLRLHPGDVWGELFDCAWFHFTGQIPESAAGLRVVLLLDVSGELLVVDDQGQPLRGLTNKASEFDYSLGRPGKRVLPWSDSACGGEMVDLWADAGANGLFGHLQDQGRIMEAHIAVLHEAVRGLYYDFEVLLDFLNVLPPDFPRPHQILHALSAAAWSLSTGINKETACCCSSGHLKSKRYGSREAESTEF
jgi:alpha-mannosidase